MKFQIFGNCLKISNHKGEVLSLGGDDNCRGDGVRDRLSIIFEDQSGNDIIPDWLDDSEKTELVRDKELTVWTNPNRFLSLLQRHL